MPFGVSLWLCRGNSGWSGFTRHTGPTCRPLASSKLASIGRRMPSPDVLDVHTSGVDFELSNLNSTSASIDNPPAPHSVSLDVNSERQPMLDTDAELESAEFDYLPIFSEKPLKPSWLHVIFQYPSKGSLDLRPTSWLDGVRGVAALGVYIFHTMACWASPIPLWNPIDHRINLVQLPFLRTLLVSGGPSVCLFFVVSGYVLTQKCLSWLREGGPAKRQVIPSVASSAFRRGFRLYLPPILLTFCEMVATRFGVPPPLNYAFAPEPTSFGQGIHWLLAVNRFINPFYNFWGAIRGLAVGIKYDPVMWTIPLEYYGSLVCYILLLLFMLVDRNWLRMSILSCLSIACLMLGCWNLFCFLAGMLIADFNLQNGSEPHSGTRYTIIWTVIFTTAFYIAGFPSLGSWMARLQPMPGFETLRSITPPLAMEDTSRFWWSISTVSVLLSASQLPRLRRVFESYFCQYLGKLAFSLYLLHEFSLALFGLRLQTWLLSLTGQEAYAGTPIYWLVSILWYLLFSVPVFAWAAQVERWVDAPSVRFARWLEAKCLERWRILKGRSESLPLTAANV